MIIRSISLVLLLLAQGCVTTGERAEPAPVSDAGAKPPPAESPMEQSPQVEVYAYRAPQQSVFQPSRPVLALVDKAEEHKSAGDLNGAAAALERALRIEPRNPHLLNKLAWVRLDQGRFDQAQSLAAKSSALAGDSPALQQDNQRVIFEARKAR